MNAFGWDFLKTNNTFTLVANGVVFSVYRVNGRGLPHLSVRLNIWRKTNTTLPTQGRMTAIRRFRGYSVT